MKNKNILLFDLDGTLTDPALGITNSVMYAFEKLNIPVESRESLYKFIGPPLLDTFMIDYKMTKEEAFDALAKYREYFTDKGMFENTVYGGMAELLCDLKNSGKKLLVATSKPEPFARQILRHFDLAKYFDFIGGSDLNETRAKKSEVIKYVLDEAGVTSLDECVMIGDRLYDVIGARENGIDAVGVLYGYGDRAELENAGAAAIADGVAELRKLLFE